MLFINILRTEINMALRV